MNVDAKFFKKLDSALRKRFGVPPEHHCDDPTGALVRGILSQNTNDRNRDRAFESLTKKFRNWNDVLHASDEEIAAAIRTAGMSGQRTERIKNLLQWLKQHSGEEIDAQFLLDMDYKRALEQLTSLPGIGVKTAAVFLLFCGDAPLFPVDTHIKRIMIRMKIFPPKTSAEKMIFALSEIVPHEIHNSLHLNLLELGRNYCTARKTMCETCPVKNICPANRKE